MSNKEKIIRVLIRKGRELFNQPYKPIKFTEVSEANELLNNLKEYPHAFVLGCMMDRQIKAKKAWLIPYKVYKRIGTFKIPRLISKLGEIKKFFIKEKPHRLYNEMAKNFCLAIEKIHRDYNDNASNIWKDKPRSATIVRRFLEFEGVGVKIATMATNILAREFKIPMEDYISIDISPDRHVKRVFKRLGLISKNASNEELIYCARELNPKYPGIFDLPALRLGAKICHQRNPNCKNCYLSKYCPKII